VGYEPVFTFPSGTLVKPADSLNCRAGCIRFAPVVQVPWGVSISAPAAPPAPAMAAIRSLHAGDWPITNRDGRLPTGDAEPWGVAGFGFAAAMRAAASLTTSLRCTGQPAQTAHAATAHLLPAWRRYSGTFYQHARPALAALTRRDGLAVALDDQWLRDPVRRQDRVLTPIPQAAPPVQVDAQTRAVRPRPRQILRQGSIRRRRTSPSAIRLAEHRGDLGRVGQELAYLLRTAAGDGDLGGPLQRFLA
jgi:hypothetical protein